MKFSFEPCSLFRFRFLHRRKRSFTLRVGVCLNTKLARLDFCMAVLLLLMILFNPVSGFAQKMSIDDHLIGPRMNLAYLYLLKGEQEKSISELKGVLSLDPSHPEALERVARSLLARGQLDEALLALEHTSQPEALSGPLLVLLGDAYLKKGNVDKAEQTYQLAVRNQSGETDAVLGLAQVSQFRGDAKNALVYLSRARKLVASSPETLYRFALVSAAAGLYEEANVSLQAAIRLKPDEPTYFLALGNTWLKKPDVAAAEQAFRRSLELQPDSAQAQMSLG